MAPKPPVAMQTSPWESEITAALAGHFGAAISEFSSYVGQNFLIAGAAAVPGITNYLKHSWGFDYLVDVTAVDYPAREERFELIYILYSYSRNERLRIKTQIAEGQRPDTLTGIHSAANWLEREVFDMFGIEFAGHPDLRRILLPDDWSGHPLRRDYGILDMDNRWVKENLGIDSGQ